MESICLLTLMVPTNHCLYRKEQTLLLLCLYTGKLVDHLNSRIVYNGAITQKEYAHTSTNWEYIGLSFTVPSGYVYLAGVSTGWNYGMPNGLGFGHSTSLVGNSAPERAIVHDSFVGQTPLYPLTPRTYYVFSKHTGASQGHTAGYYVFGFIIKN